MGTVPAAIDNEVGQGLASLYELQVNARYLALATAAVCIWDHLITADREAQYVWNNGHRRTFGKLLFVLVRWGITLVYPSSIWVLFLPSTTPGICGGSYAFTYINVLLGAASQLVLCLRVYALWDKRWWIGLTMSICWVGSLIANIALVSFYLSSPSLQVPKTNPPITGCLQAPVDNFYIGVVASIICETIVIIATLVRVITALRSHCKNSPQNSLVLHIVHSGIGYYVLMFAILVLYIIAGKAKALTVPVFSAGPLVVVQSIACSRIMLTLFSRAAKHDTRLCNIPEEVGGTRVGNGGTVFSKYTSIGDDIWTTLGTLHLTVPEEQEGGEEYNEGAWTEPGIDLQEMRLPSNENEPAGDSQES